MEKYMKLKATTRNFHFVLMLTAPVDKSSSVSPLPHVVKILFWLVRALMNQLYYSNVHIDLTLYLHGL